MHGVHTFRSKLLCNVVKVALLEVAVLVKRYRHRRVTKQPLNSLD